MKIINANTFQRVFFNLLTFLSTLVFLFWLFPTELYQNFETKSTMDIILSFLLAGISLVILSFYFFTHLKDWLDSLTGMAIVAVGIIIHIIITAFFGHGGNTILLFGYIGELILYILVIYVYEHKFKICK
jgi:FtsH-binding integral membrane protein